MENTLRKISISLLLATGLNLSMPCMAEVLKLTEAPLSQIIELYSKATGRNVFVDESVQQQRKITVHLQDMNIEEAFGIVQKTIGLESCLIGSNTLLLYPPERAQRYRPEMKPFVFRTPAGIDTKWVMGIINNLIPGLKATPATGAQRSILLFGPQNDMNKIGDLSKKLPELQMQQKSLAMSEEEARLIGKELKTDEVDVEINTGGITWKGSQETVQKFHENLAAWRKLNTWGSDVFTSENLDSQKLFKAAEAVKNRTLIKDLGGTGSLLIEGPVVDRLRVLEILKKLDRQAQKQHKELLLGEMKPELAREALKGMGVETVGDRRMILMGKHDAIEKATAILGSLGKKKKQVLIKFRLAEIAKSKLKALGIDLDKNAYSYGEIKEFHPKDTLPLLLRVLHEGKDGKILAEPNLRVIEGEEAKVTIGDRIPLEVAATAQTDSGSILKLNTQLTWVDVGIKMVVKGLSVNSDNSIKMNLKGEVSSVVATTKQGYPQIRTREAESTFRVNNEGLIVMGGLISREERENNNKIPLIGNIPLFGGLARSRDKQKTETEIIMLVTASLVQD
jgi:type II secretory pathway component GspD/PulD (secretin)